MRLLYKVAMQSNGDYLAVQHGDDVYHVPTREGLLLKEKVELSCPT
jgi:hypothetical protein